MKTQQPVAACLVAVFTGLLLCSCTTNKPASQQSVRQRFVPDQAQTPSGPGANWTALMPFPHAFGDRQVFAHAGLGDTFPVQEPGGPILFEVKVVAGDDACLTLEIQTGESPPKKINLRRDKPLTMSAGPSRFAFCYPSTQVSAAGPPTTSKALIIVRQCP